MSELYYTNSSVTEFYAGKSIFVTGGTGFIGKVLLEKLLYSTDINKIYVLIRAKESADSVQRLQEIVEKQVFERIRKVNPEALNKLVPLSGDIAKSNLGINSEDEKSLIDKVSVVFHSAANIRFNDKLDVAVNYNYEGTKRVLNLCHRMKNLKAFVHMSTTFINPQNTNLEEIIYPAPVEPEELETFINQKIEDEAEVAKFLCGRPNTYTFTKALAENYVAENHGSIPTVIIRPSIVTSSASEPFPGWIDSWSAAAAIVATTSLGYNRVLVGKSSNLIDLIPVDYVTNLAIAAAAKDGRNGLEIFNSCTTSCSPLSLYDMHKSIIGFAVKNGHNDLPIPFAIMTKDGMMKEIAVFFLENLPALIADLYMKLKGDTPRYMKLQSKVSANRELIKFFTTRSFSLSADRTIALSRSLSEKDAKTFPFNPKEINWKQYLPVYTQGIRRFLLRK